MHVYFGTYTKDRTESIYHFAFDSDTGALTPRGAVGGVTNPSFLALHPEGRFLYSVTETGPEGGAAAFAIDPGDGTLSRLNTQPSGGGGACHVAVDPAGTAVIVSNYGGGSVASFPIRGDGTLGPVASLIQHHGSSVNPQRQQGPHAHSTNVDPTGRFAVTADLGLDQLRVYRLDPETSKLSPHDPAAADLHPGAGPRHLVFHPGGRFAYVINELDATMTALNWDMARGTFETRQTLSTLPEGSDAEPSCAEVVVHPGGKFLYGSNRGHDSIVVYAIDPGDGTLTLVGHEPSGGQEPRNFNLDPTGRWLIACNQNTDNAQVFRVDENDGTLTAVGGPVAVPTPVCVKFLAR